MALKSVWGIDIGKYSIKAVRLDRKKGEIHVGATDIIPFRTLPIFDKDVRWEDLVDESMRELFFRQRIAETPVVVSLTGHQIFNRTIEIATTDPKRLPELVKHEAKQQIPGDIDEVIWDYEDVTPEGGMEREVALFALRRDVVDGFTNLLAQCQVAPLGLTVASLSVYNFISYDREPRVPLVVLDMGSDSTDLLVIDGRKVWIRPLRTTGNDFTKSIRDASGKDLADAERLKRQISRHAKKDVLIKSLEPLYNELVAEIQRSLGFYKQQAEESIDFNKMLVLGGGTRLPGFNRLLARGLQMDVESLTELKKLRVGPKTDANLFNSNLPVLASAMGLALQGLEVSPYKIDLLPGDVSRGRALESKKGWVIASGIAVLIGGLAQYGLLKVAEGRMKDADDDANRLEANITQQASELASARDHSAHQLELEHYLAGVIGVRQTSDLLDKIYALVPPEMDQNPGDDSSVTSARIGLYKLNVETPGPVVVVREEPIDPEDLEAGTTKRSTLEMTARVTLGGWYHVPGQGAKTGPYGLFKDSIERAFKGVKLEELVVPQRVFEPGGDKDDKGKFMDFQVAFEQLVDSVELTTKEEEEE